MFDFEKVLHFLKKFKGYTVFAGFSGGADSTALLLLLHKLSPSLKINLKAIHFQHNIRGDESLRDGEWCKKFCASRKIAFTETGLNVLKNAIHGEGIEAAARRLRLEAWDKILAGKKKAVVALGHHSDDRVENMFIRAFRGSNSSGLTSMRAINKIGGVTYIRPMLFFKRTEIENFLRTENIQDWRVDSTNEDTVYRRNFLRKLILPEIYRNVDFADAGLQQSVSVLEDDADFIEKAAALEFAKIRKTEKTSTKFWLKLHPAIRIRVMRSWLSERLKRDFIPDKNLMERFAEELSNARLLSGEKILIPLERNLYIKLQKGKASLLEHDSMEIIKKPSAIVWNWKKSPSIKWQGKEFSLTCEKVKNHKGYSSFSEGQACFDADQMPDKFMIRLSESGDRMQPFGAKEEVRLKKLFSGRKISADDKKNYPLLTTPDNKIIWIPGVRHSAVAPLTKQTNTILIINFPATEK